MVLASRAELARGTGPGCCTPELGSSLTSVAAVAISAIWNATDGRVLVAITAANLIFARLSAITFGYHHHRTAMFTCSEKQRASSHGISGRLCVEMEALSGWNLQSSRHGVGG